MSRRKSDKQTPDKSKADKTHNASSRLKDDSALWARVAETAQPLTNKNRFIDLEVPLDAPAPPAQAKTKSPVAAGALSRSPTAPKPLRKHAGDKVPVRTTPSPSVGLDRQTARKLDKGNLAIEARIDLHGMRQREAHSALRKFLYWARGKDYRHVLVITGKGSLRDEGRSFYDENERGVLRQAVPHWLSHGDLAPFIVSFAQAPRRLGGEGALYVRIRKQDRARRHS
jgi:DNA-nicking Smr family endonuclease